MLNRLLENVVVQQLLDEINVCQQHSPAAISLHTKLSEGFPFSLPVLEQGKVLFPFVTNNLSAREATDRDNHAVN